MTTYDPRTMPGGLDAELARLEAQAAVMWPAERRLLESWGAGRAQVIADLGCGSGALLARLGDLNAGARLIGVDHDAALLSVAGDRCACPGLAGRVELVQSELASLPLADGSVDLAVLRFVVQHLPDPVPVLAGVRRLLRPGGRVVVIDVDAELWGIAEPVDPVLAALHRRVWDVPGNGPAGPPERADRLVGRRLVRTLRAAGFAEPTTQVYSYDSDEFGVDAFGPLLDPVQLMPHVDAGTLSPAELADAVRRFRAWLARPDAYALLVGFAATGIAPDPESLPR
ncbi:class I SAM-dependent methyltransferase [Desertimonas flava]|uniref:class I SAM-dependent methyltransferase n=1 Tax=Desertimonas flava TaxID=2064846 RepID=UPI000E3555E3|nr:methyltransferase domain-containing protein [Desertimonas flava]